MQRRELLVADLRQQLLDAFVFVDVVVNFTNLNMGVQVQSLRRGDHWRFRICIEDYRAQDRMLVDARL